MLEIELLGPPRITVTGEPLKTDRRKAIGLLAYLAAEPGKHSRSQLSALLWPDYPQASAFSYLRRTLWELNQTLGKGWIEADREYAWLERQEGMELDLDEFHRLATLPDGKVEDLIQAACLYRSDWMQGFAIADTAPFEQWQLAQTEHWRVEITGVLGRLVALLEEKNDYAQALHHAQRWRELDHLNEAVWRAVMRLQKNMGDRSAAIRTYHTCRQVLQDELGIDAQAETQLLYQSIIDGEQPSPAAKREPSAQETTTNVNLPSPATAFIGRKEEISQLNALLQKDNTRLVTLLGVGGTGKTRLSIQAAAELNCCFEDGIWFIPLAAVHSLEGLVAAIARGLNFSFYQGEEAPHQQLLDYLRNKEIMVILDNFEQLGSVGSQLVGEILSSAPRVKLLVTTRERLNLQAEQVFMVSGLKIPDLPTAKRWNDPKSYLEEFSALRLFIEGARRVQPDFELKAKTLPEVVRICQLVDGLPLGIELAAAWVEVLQPREIAKEIEHNLDFLESQAADLPERQRSLRAVFETSWKLLQPDERQVFRQLCIFRGSFSRAAAESVAECSVKIIVNLVHKSWLHQVEEGRFVVHEVLRQYGRQMLQSDFTEWEATKNRHAEFYVSFLHLLGQALDSLQPEMESNIPDAWDWMVETRRVNEVVERMLPGLFHYWIIRGSSLDLLNMYRRALSALADMTGRKAAVEKAILKSVIFNLQMVGEDYTENPKERSKELLDQVDQQKLATEMGIFYSLLVTSYGMYVNFEEGSLRYASLMPTIEDLRNPWEQGYAYLQASHLCGVENQELMQKYLTTALEIFTKIGVVHEHGVTLEMLGVQKASQMDYSRAIEYTLSAQANYQQVKDMWDENQTWMALGDYYIYSGEITKALRAYEVSREFTYKSGNRRLLGLVLSWESLAISRYGNLEVALDLRMQSQAIAFEVGNLNEIAWHTWELGEIYRLMGELDLAKKYFEEAHPKFEELNNGMGLGFYHRGYGDIAIGSMDWQAAKTEYELALQHQQKEVRHFTVWGMILYHSRLAMITSRLGEIDEAAEHVHATLSMLRSWPHPDMKALITLGMASLLLAQGKYDLAVEIAAGTIHQATTWNEVKQQGRAIFEEARLHLSDDEYLAAARRGEALSVDQLIEQYVNDPRFG